MGKIDDSKSEPQFIKLGEGSAITTKTAVFHRTPSLCRTVHRPPHNYRIVSLGVRLLSPNADTLTLYNTQ